MSMERAMALDVTASYAVLPSAAPAVEPLQKPPETAAPEPTVEPPPALRDNDVPRVEIESWQSRMSIHLRGRPPRGIPKRRRQPGSADRRTPHLLSIVFETLDA